MAEIQYRAYFFGNMYLSQIQQGIQAAHVTAEMFTKYSVNTNSSKKKIKLMEWANNHKTMILLNGGMQEQLDELYNTLNSLSMGLLLPSAKFKEEKAALNDATTSIGIILPSFIYDNIGVSDAIDSPTYKLAYESYVVLFYGEYLRVQYGKEYFGSGILDKAFEMHKLIKQFRLA